MRYSLCNVVLLQLKKGGVAKAKGATPPHSWLAFGDFGDFGVSFVATVLHLFFKLFLREEGLVPELV